MTGPSNTQAIEKQMADALTQTAAEGENLTIIQRGLMRNAAAVLMRHATPTPEPVAQAEPLNPYGAGGSMAEAWRRGFNGENCIAHTGSDYDRAWREGLVARKACGSQTAESDRQAALTRTDEPQGGPVALQGRDEIPQGWRFVRNTDGSIGIFAPPPREGESRRTSDCVYARQSPDLHELLGKLADHQAARASLPHKAEGAEPTRIAQIGDDLRSCIAICRNNALSGSSDERQAWNGMADRLRSVMRSGYGGRRIPTHNIDQELIQQKEAVFDAAAKARYATTQEPSA